jgi:hypothetical protein
VHFSKNDIECAQSLWSPGPFWTLAGLPWSRPESDHVLARHPSKTAVGKLYRQNSKGSKLDMLLRSRLDDCGYLFGPMAGHFWYWTVRLLVNKIPIWVYLGRVPKFGCPPNFRTDSVESEWWLEVTSHHLKILKVSTAGVRDPGKARWFILRVPPLDPKILHGPWIFSSVAKVGLSALAPPWIWRSRMMTMIVSWPKGLLWKAAGSKYWGMPGMHSQSTLVLLEFVWGVSTCFNIRSCCIGLIILVKRWLCWHVGYHESPNRCKVNGVVQRGCAWGTWFAWEKGPSLNLQAIYLAFRMGKCDPR